MRVTEQRRVDALIPRRFHAVSALGLCWLHGPGIWGFRLCNAASGLSFLRRPRRECGPPGRGLMGPLRRCAPEDLSTNAILLRPRQKLTANLACPWRYPGLPEIRSSLSRVYVRP